MSAAAPFEAVLSDLRDAVAQDLRPNIEDIDARGVYPRAFMERMGALGGFAQGVPTCYGGAGHGVEYTVKLMEEVARENV